MLHVHVHSSHIPAAATASQPAQPTRKKHTLSAVTITHPDDRRRHAFVRRFKAVHISAAPRRVHVRSSTRSATWRRQCGDSEAVDFRKVSFFFSPLPKHTRVCRTYLFRKSSCIHKAASSAGGGLCGLFWKCPPICGGLGPPADVHPLAILRSMFHRAVLLFNATAVREGVQWH